MVKGLYTAYTGMINEQKRLDVLSNNLANADTNGYKKEGTTSQTFADELAIKIKDTSSYGLAQKLGTISMGVHISQPMLLLYSYSILNIFDFQYIIRDIGVVNIATVYFLDCFHHTNCHRKDNNFIHGFQHNLNPHHDKQFFPGNNSTKSYREENQ